MNGNFPRCVENLTHHVLVKLSANGSWMGKSLETQGAACVGSYLTASQMEMECAKFWNPHCSCIACIGSAAKTRAKWAEILRIGGSGYRFLLPKAFLAKPSVSLNQFYFGFDEVANS